jgi:hypothetical protein
VQSQGDIHFSGYQARDREVIDYRMTELPGTGLLFRGPLPETLAAGGYFAAVGAAQTLGCFCEAPYPALLAQAIGLPALNLGYGGAGPEFFLRQQALLLPWLNRARFVVLQVMSGRSQSNSYYTCDGLEFVTLRRDGRRPGAAAAFDELLAGPGGLKRLPLPHRVRRKLGHLTARPRAQALIEEIRGAWVESNLALLARIEAPVVLFWFSKRAPAYHESYGSARKLFGEFPHLVTPAMLDALRPHVAAYVECVSDRGSPQRLVSRFTGAPVTVSPADDRPDLAGKRPWAENHYYPSPEMHEDGAGALRDVCARIAAAG